MKIKQFLENNREKYIDWLDNDNFGGIHIKILEYLKEIENGFFVECGAHDGIFQSNTKLLEDFGWDGLLIEPSDFLYEECKKNRKCLVENYALVSSSYKENFIHSDHTGNLLKNGKGILLMGNDLDNKCPVITFTDLAKKHNIYKVDVFFLDVEGYEIEVLNGIDFESTVIDYFVIEVNSDYFSLDQLDKIMSQNGYVRTQNLSNFNNINCPTWPGNHQDYLYSRLK